MIKVMLVTPAVASVCSAVNSFNENYRGAIVCGVAALALGSLVVATKKLYDCVYQDN